MASGFRNASMCIVADLICNFILMYTVVYTKFKMSNCDARSFFDQNPVW